MSYIRAMRMPLPLHVGGNSAGNINEVGQNRKMDLNVGLLGTYVPADTDSKTIKHSMTTANILHKTIRLFLGQVGLR